jgi:uncharacterized SAM-binding protein YcdF (DUF218 family)
MHSLKKPLALLLAVLSITIAATVVAYRTIPTHNTNVKHFDAIIVLGAPANLDGTPSPEQRERTLEGVREYKAGIAPSIILTGGPAHNQFVEAHVMATLALAQSVPPQAVIEEDQAVNTIQNIFYSQRIMAAHQWTSAEVVSSPNHLPRAALILEHFALVWRTHPAPWPSEYTIWQRLRATVVEAQYCLKLRLFGFPTSRFIAVQGQG